MEELKQSAVFDLPILSEASNTFTTSAWPRLDATCRAAYTTIDGSHFSLSRRNCTKHSEEVIVRYAPCRPKQHSHRHRYCSASHGLDQRDRPSKLREACEYPGFGVPRDTALRLRAITKFMSRAVSRANLA